MKKIIFSFTLILLLNPLYSKEIQILNKEMLVGKTYEFHYFMGNSTVKFIDGINYTINYGSSGWYWNDEGTYELKGGKIFLFPKKCTVWDTKENDCARSMGKAFGVIEEDTDSLYFTRFLKITTYNNRNVYSSDGIMGLKSISYDMPEFEVKPGTLRKIDGIPVSIVGKKKAVTTDNVKIRKSPFVQQNNVVKYLEQMYGGEPMDYVPANKPCVLIARTIKKEKVQKWENYWYYVEVGANDGVWMFGEFVREEGK